MRNTNETQSIDEKVFKVITNEDIYNLLKKTYVHVKELNGTVNWHGKAIMILFSLFAVLLGLIVVK